MRDIVTRPRARTDLEGIWLYTFEQWGAEQAARYLHRVDERIMQAAAEPERGQCRAEARAGYYSVGVGRHVVFYTFTDQLIAIERVLHDQMDVERHL